MPQPEKRVVGQQRLGDLRARARRRRCRVNRQWPAFERAHAAGPLVAVERQRVGRELVAPERLLEAARRSVGARRCAARRARARCPARVASAAACAPRRVDVALHLAQRDRPLGQRAVGVEDRVVRVLPALLHQPAAACGGRTRRSRRRRGRRRSSIQSSARSRFGQSRSMNAQVAGALGSTRRPASRTAASRRRCRSSGRTGPRPAPPSRRRASRAGSCPARRRWRRSSRVACVAARKRSTPRAMSGLTHSISQRGDDAVAAERRAEPGHAGVGIGPVRRLGDHHVQVGERAVEPVVELLVGRADAGSRVRSPSRRARRGAHRSAVVERSRRAGRCAIQLAGDDDEDRALRSRVEVQVEARARRRDPVGCRRAVDARAPDHAVEALVAEHDCRARRRPARAAGPAAVRCVPRTSKMSAKSASKRSVERRRRPARRRSSRRAAARRHAPSPEQHLARGRGPCRAGSGRSLGVRCPGWSDRRRAGRCPP